MIYARKNGTLGLIISEEYVYKWYGQENVWNDMDPTT